MAGHATERHPVDRRQQLPVEEAGYAAGAERRDLAQGTLTDAVPEPGVTGEPPDAPQHQLTRPGPENAPPVDQRPRLDCRGPASSKVFADQTPQDQAGHPAEDSSIPAEPAADRLQIAHRCILGPGWDGDVHDDGVHAVDQAPVARQQ